jgi:hypothetical protein
MNIFVFYIENDKNIFISITDKNIEKIAELIPKFILKLFPIRYMTILISEKLMI